MSILDAFFSLSADVNKTSADEVELQEGGAVDKVPELKLSMADDELLELKRDWEKRWKAYEPKILKKWTQAEEYWKGQHFSQVELSSELNRPFVDNLIFESVETFLPVITRQNPEPLVASDDTPEGEALATKVKKVLVYQADIQRLKLKLKKVARHWAIYMLGVAKVGWSMVENDMVLVNIRPQRLILDPEATIQEGGIYTGSYLGELITDKASNLIKRFPKKRTFIEDEVHDKTGTDVNYTEWWTSDYVFWTLKNEVLGKLKNPHWNWEGHVETTVDAFGQPTSQQLPPSNHLSAPAIPYIFLSVFNLGLQPFDDISLLDQALPVQDMINKRWQQIDRNADNANAGIVVSGDHFTKEQAAQAADALRKGNAIWVPTGDVNRAIKRDQPTILPPYIYQSLIDAREQLRNIFGVRGISPQGTINEQTVRGKIIINQQDQSRLGLITEYLEQFTDYVFNWFVQLMYVNYDEEHALPILGTTGAQEYIKLKNTDFTKKLLVSVKEGSLIPKDELSKRNEAVDLWAAGALDPITLFERLGFPNPKETAQKLLLWKSNPMALFGQSQAPQIPGQSVVPQGQPKQPMTTPNQAAPLPPINNQPI